MLRYLAGTKSEFPEEQTLLEHFGNDVDTGERGNATGSALVTQVGGGRLESTGKTTDDITIEGVNAFCAVWSGLDADADAFDCLEPLLAKHASVAMLDATEGRVAEPGWNAVIREFLKTGSAIGRARGPWLEFGIKRDRLQPNDGAYTRLGLYGRKPTSRAVQLAIAFAADAVDANLLDIVQVGQHGTSVIDGEVRFGTWPSWWTWFGPRALAYWGGERVRTAPAEVVEESGGGVIVQLTRAYDDPRGKLRGEVATRVKAHFGADAFATPTRVYTMTARNRRVGPLDATARNLLVLARSAYRHLGWVLSMDGIRDLEGRGRVQVREAAMGVVDPATMTNPKLFPPILLGIYLGDTARTIAGRGVWGSLVEEKTLGVDGLPGLAPARPLRIAQAWLGGQTSSLTNWVLLATERPVHGDSDDQK